MGKWNKSLHKPVLFRSHLKAWLFALLTNFKSSCCSSMLTLTVFSANLPFEVLQLHQYSTLLLSAHQIYLLLSYSRDNKWIKTKEEKENVTSRDHSLFAVLNWSVISFLTEWEEDSSLSHNLMSLHMCILMWHDFILWTSCSLGINKHSFYNHLHACSSHPGQILKQPTVSGKQ